MVYGYHNRGNPGGYRARVFVLRFAARFVTAAAAATRARRRLGNKRDGYY